MVLVPVPRVDHAITSVEDNTVQYIGDNQGWGDFLRDSALSLLNHERETDGESDGEGRERGKVGGGESL